METDKRIRILNRAADFLWKYDEPTARAYFAEAFKTASDRFKEKGLEKRKNKGLTTILPDYRFDLIKAVAAKDPEWAKSLFRARRQATEKCK